MKNTVALIAVLCLLSSCGKEGTTTPDPPKTVSELIARAGRLPEAPPSQETEVGTAADMLEEDGERYVSTSSKRRLSARFEEIGSFGKYADVLYPGAIVQGKELQQGRLTPIEGRKKEIVLTLDNGTSMQVGSPTKASVNDAIQRLAVDSKPSAAQMVYQYSVIHSKESAFMKLGLNVDWLVGNIGNEFTEERSTKRSSVLLYLKQVYFTVSSDKPGFDSSVPVADLQPFIGEGNPPCYISTVSYGRIFLIKVTATTSSEELENTLKAGYRMVSGQVEFTNLDENTTYSFQALVFGGSAQGAAKAITLQSIGEVNALIRREAQYSPTNPGMPISYTLRHLYDLSPVLLGQSVEYSIPKWEMDPNVRQNFDITFSSLEIGKDCDFGTAGDGDFYYRFEVFDRKGNRLGSPVERRWNDYVQGGDGEAIPINKTISFSIPRVHGESFRIMGYVRDNDSDDDSTDYQSMGAINLTMAYPWEGGDYNRPLYYSLDGSSSCNGKVYFLISTKR